MLVCQSSKPKPFLGYFRMTESAPYELKQAGIKPTVTLCKWALMFFFFFFDRSAEVDKSFATEVRKKIIFTCLSNKGLV